MPNHDSRPASPPPSATAALSTPGTPTTATTANQSQHMQKADQIAHRFFIKFLLILAASRSTAIEQGPRSTKVDKWFNLETPDTDIHRDHMRAFRSISTLSTLPTLTLHTVLIIPEIGSNRALVAIDALDNRMRIEPTPRAVLLETWTLSVLPPSPGSLLSLSSSDSGEASLPAVYKHAISLFRSLYTLCRQLPTSKLVQRYRQRTGVPMAPQAFGIELRLHLDNTVLTFDASPSPSRPIPLPVNERDFPPLSTPLGGLRVAVRYLTQPNFRIDTLEALISSRLFNQDAAAVEESVVFTPTVLAHRARESAASSPGSIGLPIRNSRPPPSITTGQRHSRTTSFPAITGVQPPRIPPSLEGASAGGSISDYDATRTSRLVPGTSPRFTGFRPEPLAFAPSNSSGKAPGTPARTSLDGAKPGSAERTTFGTSTSPPSMLSRLQPQGTSPASPVVPPISAFRSSTLIPSGMNSPSTSLRSLGMGTPGLSRPPSSLPHAIPEASASGAASSRPWPVTSSSPQSAGLAFPTGEPPPFASASTSAPRAGVSPLAALLGGTPRSGESNSSGGIVTKTPGKRYSSSFGHRRAPSAGGTGAGSSTPGSAGASMIVDKRHSGITPNSPAPGLVDLPSETSKQSSTLLEPTEHEENLSEFIREIDNARLRSNRMSESRSSSSPSSSGLGVNGVTHARRVSLAERRQSPLVGRLELPPPPSPRSPPARLQELNLTGPDPEEEDTQSGDAGAGTSANPTGRIGMQISNDPQALGMQLQNMDDAFKKSLQGLKNRRRVSSRPTEPSPLGDDRQASSSGLDANDTSRRAGPSFRSGTVRDRPTTETDSITANSSVPTPGDHGASDGSGYAGVVGRLDFDSPELRTQDPLNQRRLSQQQQRQPSEMTYPLPGLYPPATGHHSSSRDSNGARRISGEQEEDSEERYDGDREGASPRPERTSKYTSVLRRDATLRANDPSRTSSSSSTAPSDPSRVRRPAAGWSGASPPQ